MQKILDSVASRRSPGCTLEIEVKYLVDPRPKYPRFVKVNTTVSESIEFAKSLITAANSPTVLEETINFIENSETNIIKQLAFHRGVQIKEKKNFYTKRKITDQIYLTSDGPDSPLKISISEEKIIPEQIVKENLVRFKLRLSILPSAKFVELSKWRIDITLTKTLQKVASIAALANIRDVMFPNLLTSENFIAMAPWKFADAIEVEIESMAPETVSEKSLANMIAEFRGLTQKPDTIQDKFYEIANILDPRNAHMYKPPETRGLKSMTNNVIELTRSMWFSELLPKIQNYKLTDKADGMRVLIHLAPRRGIAVILSAQTMEILKIPIRDMGDCLADSEKVEVESNFLIFDVMMFDGNNMSAADFSERIKFIPAVAELSCNFFGKTYWDFPEGIDAIKLEQKPFPYNTDGIIFAEKSGAYSLAKNYKWKPIEDTTIDFLVRRCPKSLLGVEPYIMYPDKTLYLLFSGIRQDMMNRLSIKPIRNYRELFPNRASKCGPYSPIQFSPSSRPNAYLFYSDNANLDNKIVELHYSAEWRLHRIRDDKNRDAECGIAFGNDFRVAELIWLNYFNPLTIEDLKLKEDGAYFKEHDVAMYRALRSYNSCVKELLFKLNRGLSHAIDLGSGKGQDLFRYVRSNIQTVLFVDLDRMALDELISRKYYFARDPAIKGQSINVNTLEMDLNTDYNEVLATIHNRGYQLPAGGVPLIICNLAIHYFVGTVSMRTNFVNLIKSLLAPGGRFVFTTFDGKKVFNLVKAAGGKWDQIENGVLKYSIHAEYDDAAFTGNNQKIKVLHPFSDNTYYSEYLVSSDLMKAAFKSVGLKQELYRGFGEYQPEVEKLDKKMSKALTQLDLTYASLYSVYVFTRT